MRTLILCGGKGTRAHPHTMELPKPLLEVAGRPVLAHLLDIYAAQGFTDFVLAGGYRIEALRRFADEVSGPIDVEVVDTGDDADTGERVVACRDRMGDRFHLTYGDGLGDVDLRALLELHHSRGGAATMTTVPLPSQYGTVETTADGRVERFREKPSLPDHAINAGFMVLEQAAFEHWALPSLERDALPALGAAGLLYAYAHPGFWRSMDTFKDAVELSELCADGRPPWAVVPRR